MYTETEAGSASQHVPSGLDHSKLSEHKRRIVVCICTYKRPKMLMRCLESLADAEIPSGYELFIVVVDNEEHSHNERGVSAFKEGLTQAALKVVYWHEPKRGISSARNAAIAQALEYRAEVVAMFDDDQIISKTCISRAMETMRAYQADVVSCAFRAILPSPPPFWHVPPSASDGRPAFALRMLARLKVPFGQQRAGSPKYYDGRSLRECNTGGVLFSAKLIEPEGFGLRFDESFGLNGGEDISFFGAAHRKGARIVESAQAIVSEDMMAARMTWHWQCYRYYCNAAGNLKMQRKEHGSRVIPAYLWKATTRSVRSVAEIPLLPFYVPFSLRFFKFRALKVSKQIFWAGGIAANLIGHTPKPYARIHGD